MRSAKRKRRAKRMAAKRWFLYLIECRDGSVYTGITVDVAARYAAHAEGKGARYTRSHPPRRLLAVVDYPDRSSALSAEHAVKTMSPGEKRAYALLLALGDATAE
jgi:putative endonuclease